MTDRRALTAGQWVVLAAVVAVMTVVVVLVLSGRDGSESSGIDVSRADDATEFAHDFVIPAGTGDRIDAGEQIEIVPAELVVEVGDAVRIVNSDDRDHVVGVFFVAAGETLTQRFNSVAVLEGDCSVHPSGSFTLRVVEAA